MSKLDVSGTVLERLTIEGDSPVHDNEESLVGYLSRTGHANPV